MANSGNVVFVTRFSNQIVFFSTKSWVIEEVSIFLGRFGQPLSSMAVDVEVAAYLRTKQNMQ